jgi:hypothetical protein
MPDRMSEYKSDKMPNRNPDRMSECIFQKCQNVYSRKNARWNVRMYIPERMPDRMSEYVSDRISVGGDERIYVCVTMFFGKV